MFSPTTLFTFSPYYAAFLDFLIETCLLNTTVYFLMILGVQYSIPDIMWNSKYCNSEYCCNWEVSDAL
jgi:hypothetical protein